MSFNPTEIVLNDEELPRLYTALEDRHFKAAAKLISDGARLDDIIDVDGYTLLHWAAREGDLKMVDFFLKHECPVTLEQFDEIANTPLILAAENGQTEVVVRLLAARVDPNANDEERIGNTAIREAVRAGHVEIVSLLLEAGADPLITGWMNISAVDQAWYNVRGSHETSRQIRSILASYPSPLRDKQKQAEQDAAVNSQR